MARLGVAGRQQRNKGTDTVLIILSPAKRLDFSPLGRPADATKPELHTRAKKLAALMKGKSPGDIKKLMSVSDKLAEDAHGYFQSWKQKADAAGAKQAAFAFRGDVYLGLEADTLKPKELDWAQQHLRILSGLYGVLRPLDLIQPYRLEMGTRLVGEHGGTLYDFWGGRIRGSLAGQLSEQKKPLLVNLASKEYATAARLDEVDAPQLTPVFKDKGKGGYRVMSFFAKKARGMMARHLVQTRAKGPEAVLAFSMAGYRYDPGSSTEQAPTFLRDSPE